MIYLISGENMKNLTTAKKLEKLYQIMLSLEQELGVLPSLNVSPTIQTPSLSDYFKKLAEQEFKIQAFSQMVKFVGYTDLPEIVSDEKYSKLAGYNFDYLGMSFKGTELYRGVREIAHHANLLCDEEYHTGVGDACNGLFASNMYDKANLYSSRNSKFDCVLKFKAPELKIIDDDTLKVDITRVFEGQEPSTHSHKQILEEVKNFTLSINDPNYQSAFFYTLLNDPSIIAILLGYDAIYDHNFPAFAILNRGKIVVSEKEYERICRESGRTTPKQFGDSEN